MRDDSQDLKVRLTYGRASTQYEDGIVGNEHGLRSLAKAIEQALENGESDVELHEFTNIYFKPDSFFPPEEAQDLGLLGKTIFFLVITFLLGLIGIGGYTFFNWLSQ